MHESENKGRRIPYGWKRVLGYLLGNAQSMRWMTQGIELARLWRGRIEPGMSCLDVGCGGGTYAIERFLGKGARAVLADHSEDLARLARDQVADAGLSDLARFVVCDARALPFADGAFDRVQSMEVMEHLDDPGRALREMRRVAAPWRGQIVVSVPHPPEWFANPDHVVEGYTGEELSGLLAGAGWRTGRVRFCMLLPTRLMGAVAHLFRGVIPLPFLLLLEALVPDRLRRLLLPYDVMVRGWRDE